MACTRRSKRLDAPLDEHRAVAERRKGLRRGREEFGLQLVDAAHDAHAAAATAECCLAYDRVADLVAEGLGLGDGVDGRLCARNDGYVELARQFTGLGLVTKSLDDVRRRPDKHDVCLLAQLHEARVLREEAITRMDGVNVVLHGDVYNLFRGEVGPHG